MKQKSKPCVCLFLLPCVCVFALVFPTVMTHGTAISPLYHFTLSDGTPLSAQTRCKFCCPPNPEVQPFIMGIHTIDRYCVGPVHTLMHRFPFIPMVHYDYTFLEPIPNDCFVAELSADYLSGNNRMSCKNAQQTS